MHRMSQIFPISLLGMYMILSILTNFDFYNEEFYNVVIKIDTFLLICSTTAAFFYIHKWKTLPTLSFATVIALNVLTEMSFRTNITLYYELYQAIIVLFFLMMAVLSPHKTT